MKKIIIALVGLSMILLGCGNDAQYGEDVQNLSDEIMETSIQAEEVLDNYSSIWSTTIQSRGALPVEEVMYTTNLDEETVREYFVINSADNVPDDFNLNIVSLKSYYKDNGTLGEIEESLEVIKENISELNNPPEDYEQAYEELLDLYTYSSEYINLALNPEGSLQSFNDKKSELSSNILNKYQRIEVVTPSE